MKRPSRSRSLHALFLTLCALFLGTARASAGPQGGGGATMPEAFYRAYYLEHERRDLLGALELYRQVAESDRYQDSQRSLAAKHAAGVAEDLASSDLARLFPKGTLAYLELTQPGDRLSGLLDVLGLMQGRDGALAGSFAGISPLLVESLFGMRAMAMGLTQVNPMTGQTSSVAVLNPGDLDLLRGLIQTLAPNGGTLVDPIAEHATYKLGEGYLTITERLVVVSRNRREIDGVVKRLEHGGACFSDSPAMLATADLRGQDMAFFCLNVEPLMSVASMGLNMVAKREPQLAAILNLIDLGSLRACAGRIGLGSEGLGLDLALQMREGHSNKIFNLLRMPNLDAGSLALVPEGAAFFLATAFNESARGDVGTIDSLGRPVVTFMDIGRELFGNIVDVSFFAMPEVERGQGEAFDGRMAQNVSLQGPDAESQEPPLPQAGLILRVNDAERSRAMWDLVLSTATLAAGARPESFELAGFPVTRYLFQGMPVFLGSTGEELVLSPSRSATERSLIARRSGFSIKDDDSYREALANFSNDKTMALFASPGRVATLASQLMPGAEADQARELGELLGEAAVALSFAHSETRLGISLDVAHVPNINEAVAQALAPQLDGGLEQLPLLGSLSSLDRALQRTVSAAGSSSGHEPARASGQSQGSAPSSAGSSAAAARADASAVQAVSSVAPTRVAVAQDPMRAGFDQLKQRFQRSVDAKSGEAQAFGRELIHAAAADADYLNDFATELMQEARYAGQYNKLALSAAELCNDLSGYENSAHVDTLAAAHFELGDIDLAIELEELAVELAGDGGTEPLTSHLKQFRGAREPLAASGGGLAQD